MGKILNFKDKCIQGHTADNIVRGIKEGCYGPEIMLIFYKITGRTSTLMFKPTVFSNADFDFKQVQLQVLDHFIHDF